MKSYVPRPMELAPRDIVSRCIQTEINEGRVSTIRWGNTFSLTCGIWVRRRFWSGFPASVVSVLILSVLIR